MISSNILIGITGGIAAYKIPDLVRRLREQGANVRVVMTGAACEFIAPLTLQAVSGNPVSRSLLSEAAEAAMGHIELARWADMIVIAPASADCLARLAHGHANDLLTTTCLASEAQLALAPAMNQRMWQHPATRANAETLAQRGAVLLGPGEGEQACGDVGPGRMLEPDTIVSEIARFFMPQCLRDTRVLVTAGPTFERLDPIRYFGNRSSGKMGFALANAAKQVGAQVTLISGPSAEQVSSPIRRIDVVSAREMHAAVMAEIDSSDLFISAAAVADYRPKVDYDHKIKKTAEDFSVTFERNPDILLDVSQRARKPFLVGFAAETENLQDSAKAKLHAKSLDMLIANEISETNGMEVEDNQVSVWFADGKVMEMPKLSKKLLAYALLPIIAKAFRPSGD